MVDAELHSDEKKCSEGHECCCDNEEDEGSAKDFNEQEKIESLEEEVKSLKDTLLRNFAETENLRKRLAKEKSDVEKYANSKFAKDLLVVIDNFNRVTESKKTIEEAINNNDALKAFFDGVVLCGKELLSVFARHGIKPIDINEGEEFNPHYHQVVLEVEKEDCKPGTIVEVFQHGYIYNDRLLRPTMVSVSKKHEQI